MNITYDDVSPISKKTPIITTSSYMNPFRSHHHASSHSLFTSIFLDLFARNCKQVDDYTSGETFEEQIGYRFETNSFRIDQHPFMVSGSSVMENNDIRRRFIYSLLSSQFHSPIPSFKSSNNFTVVSDVSTLNYPSSKSNSIFLHSKPLAVPSACTLTTPVICNAWTVGQLRLAILTRFTCPSFLRWNMITTDDSKFAVVNVSWDAIDLIKRIRFGEDEIIDSSLWYSGVRSFVLIVCPHRDVRMMESRENFSQTGERRGTFPDGKSILHPAHVRCFIRVKYDVISKVFQNKHGLQIDTTSPLPRSDVYLQQKKESEYHLEETTFAVCDFFRGHHDRLKWSFAGEIMIIEYVPCLVC
jgi:hypothetical protein